MPCVDCGTLEALVEHHISYVPEEKIDICRSCHAKRHMNGESHEIPDNWTTMVPLSVGVRNYLSEKKGNLSYDAYLRSLFGLKSRKRKRRYREKAKAHILKDYVYQGEPTVITFEPAPFNPELVKPPTEDMPDYLSEEYHLLSYDQKQRYWLQLYK